ncbi:carboxypeptidase-like regulatory domain-containing protein [candidate division KSB1 bacterium]
MTDISIIFSDELVQDILVSGDFKDAGLEYVLRQLLRNNGLYFSVSSNFQIIIHRQPYPGLKHSQITGRVTDKATGEPLEYVNVFIANTFLGAATDIDGNYTIYNVPVGSFTLVVSMIGYEVQERKIRFTVPTYDRKDFSLEETVEELEEVVVTAVTPEKWKDYYKEFEKSFIGDSQNARYTKITNPEVLDFDYDEKYKILTAKADEALIIENHALGYKIYYSLMEFTKAPRYLAYKGYPRFLDLFPDDLREARGWLENREKTYNGSLRHFLWCLINEDINDTDFKVKEVIRDNNYYDDLSLMDITWRRKFFINSLMRGFKELKKEVNISMMPGEIESERKLKFRNYLKIEYKYRSNASIIGLWGESALLNVKGYMYEPYDLLITGKWGECRVADLLPFEYELKEKTKSN